MNTFEKRWSPAAAALVAGSVCWLIAGAVLAAPDVPAPDQAAEVRIGVLAARGSAACLQRWQPMAEYLTQEIPGRNFVIRPLGYNEAGGAVRRREVDFILANPSLYIELESGCGASRILTMKNACLDGSYTVYAGVIFCRADRHEMQSLPDLRGKTLMAVAEDSFGGWQMAWREMKEQGIDPAKDFRHVQFGSTHDAVVHAVREGRVDAGTVRSDTLERMASEGTIRLEEFRVLNQQVGGEFPLLHSTRIYPEWPLAKLRHTPDPLAEQVALALMRMSPTAPLARTIPCAGWTIPHNYQPVHECLKELRLGPYKDYGKITLGAAIRRYWPYLAGVAALLVAASTVSVYVTQLNRRLRQALWGQSREFAERMRAEEALRASERLRARNEKLAAVGQAVTGIQHAIKNMLGSLTGGLYLIRIGLGKDNRQRIEEGHGMIEDGVERIGKMSRNMLNYVKEWKLQLQPTDLTALTAKICRANHTSAAERGVNLRDELPDDLPGVVCDPELIRMAMTDLLVNAIEACAEKNYGPGETPEVVLANSAMNGRGDFVIEVRDNGCGMSDQTRRQIFTPYFSTKQTGGTGLGLAMTVRIIEAHGGAISVESEPDRGSRFRIHLPLDGPRDRKEVPDGQASACH